jgi:hypothetical protein
VGPDIKVDTDEETYVMAKPVVDTQGREVLNPQQTPQDKVLQIALEKARSGQ